MADSDGAFVRALGAHLKADPEVKAEGIGSSAALVKRVLGGEGDLVFLSSELDGSLKALEEIKRGRPEVEVVVTTARARMEAAVRIMKLGASDYLAKPLKPEQVALAITRARRVRRLEEENRRLREQLQARGEGSEIVGRTPAMSRVLEEIGRASAGEGGVLILGESGTEKERAAREIHGRTGPFARLECPPGREVDPAAEAIGGTLYLEDVAELPLTVQDRLLGASGTARVRLIAGSSRNLLEMVGRGTFRREFLERLSAFTLTLPPLRERLDDLPLLAEAFLRRRSGGGKKGPRGIAADALATLLAYSWPGNVQELEQALERACDLGEGDVVERRHLPLAVIQGAEERRKIGDVEIATRSLREMESEVIHKLLEEHRGNTEVVSNLLKIDRSTLYRKIKRYGIDLDQLKP